MFGVKFSELHVVYILTQVSVLSEINNNFLLFKTQVAAYDLQSITSN